LIASCEVAVLVLVLVQTSWHGRLQEVLTDRDYVLHRHRDPNAH